jgi:SAM-dependent methyltransferase
MHPQFLEYLCCPETQEPLHLDAQETRADGMIITGTLQSPSGKSYPILRGIPRFVSQELYAASFGYEWTRWPRVQFEAENANGPMAGHTTRMWEIITGGRDDIAGNTLVEFGCGPGRFLDVVRRKGGRAIGIDMSLAVETARKNFQDDPDVLIIQADLLHPPIRQGTMDGGFTIGVLHHTSDPLKGLTALARAVRTGGWIACSVYPKQGLYASRAVARHRRVYNRLKPFFGYRLPLAYTYFSAYVLAPLFKVIARKTRFVRTVHYLQNNWLPCLYYLPDVRWRLLDTFDAITPAIATTHTSEEVIGWMEQAGCDNIHTTDWGDTSVTGRKTGLQRQEE